MTGNIGRPGTGANSITGQCNAMGSRLFSNTTNLLGGRDFTDPAHRAEVAALLDIPEERIPTDAELVVRQIIEGIRAGEIRGLWVVATNPAHSWIDQGELRETLGKLDFLVVQDMYHSTETAAARRPAAAGGGLGREGRDVHQLGAPGRPDQEGPPRARASALGLSHLQAGGPLLRLRRDVRRVGVARGGLSDPQAALGGPALRHHAASPTTARSTRRGGIQWPYPAENPDPTPAAAALRRRPVLPPRRPRPVPLRGAAAAARAAGRRVSLSAPDRPRQRGAVAHADADGQVGRAPQALPARPVRRDQPGRRRGPRPGHRPLGGRRVAARVGPRAGVRHPDRARRAALPAHARRRDQPADPRGVRPRVATAGLQGLRGAGSPGR